MGVEQEVVPFSFAGGFIMRDVFLALLMVAISGLAHAADKPEGWNYGNVSCGTPMSCESVEADIPSLARMTDTCLLQRLGYGLQGGNFEVDQGLNGDRCLVTKPVPKNANGRTVTALCCIVEESSVCHMQCSLTGTR